MKNILRALPLFVLLGACATKKEVLNAPSDSGAKATYKEPYDQVKRAATDSLLEMGYSFKQEGLKDEFTWYALYSQGVSTGTSGRYARLTITKGDTERTVYFLVRSKTESAEAMKTDDVLAQDLHKRTAGRLTPK
jgi:hypothetical protein